MSRPITSLAAFALTAALTLFLPACGQEPETTHPVPTAPTFTGKLDLEIRGSADVTLTGAGASDATISLVVTGAAAPHLLDDGTKLEGSGRFETVPEAGMELYVAKLSLPADPDGPCAEKPRAAALSLYHRKTAPRFAGALTLYCGTDHFGTPARIFRLSGSLTLAK